MPNEGKNKKATSKKASHPDLDGKKSKTLKNPPKTSNAQVRLSIADDTNSKKRQSGSSKSRKSSASDKLKEEIKVEEELNQESYIAGESFTEDTQPLDPEKSKEKAKVLKKFLDHKYKVEFPVVEGSLEKNEKPPTDKEILARNGVDLDLSNEEQLHLLNIYQKLEEGIEQAEEFFRSIGIEWSSEHQMFKVKPKKFMPAMTMIAFGPGYDDVIVCKDNEDTGETKACLLTKENKDCPEDVTAINLNVYKDGFQAEDDEFNAYTSDSIRDFFLNNIGSYVIMKPNDTTPQTVLIRVVDEKERSYEEVKKERSQGIPIQSNKTKKKKSKAKERPRKFSNVAENGPIISEEEPEPVKPKYYTRSNSKAPSMTETVEIFEKHKIIKRFEDMPIEQDGIGSSSWYWRNQRNPLSSEYVVPPNITTTTFETEGTTDKLPNTNYDQKAGKVPTVQADAPRVDEVVKTTKEKSTSVTDSITNTDKKRSPIQGTARTRESPIVNHITSTNMTPVGGQDNHPDLLQSRQTSETKINKINIYHGPVTVINLGETSDDSVRISPRPDNKLKVSLRRDGKNKGPRRDGEESLSSAEWNMAPPVSNQNRNQKKSEETKYVDPWDSFDDHKEKYIFGGGHDDLEEGEDMYETEYDYAYNQSTSKWTEFFSEAARKRSVGGANIEDELANATFKNISVLGQSPPPDFTSKTRPEKKMSVLLDLGGQTGKRETIEGIELNKKTSDTQITVALRDNVNGKKYLVNIYPEEQLKKIWSILKINKIDIQDVTPELVLGNTKPQEISNELPSQLDNLLKIQEVQTKAKEDDKKSHVLTSLGEKGKDLEKLKNEVPGHKADKDNLSIASKITDQISNKKDNVSEGSEKSNRSEGAVEGKPPSIQSEMS